MSQQNVNEIIAVNENTIKTWIDLIRSEYLPHIRVQKRELLDELEGMRLKLYPASEDGTFQKIEDQLALCEKAKQFYENHIRSDFDQIKYEEEEYID